MSSDLFGLQRERKIVRSGVREVFSPHRPINQIDLFFGRREQVRAIIEQLNTPGQHSLLYGDRGVGKSSLANIASELLLSDMVSGRLYFARCDSSSTFESILAAPLTDLGYDLDVTGSTSTRKTGGSAKLKIPIAEGGFDSQTETQETRKGLSGSLSPSLATEILKGSPALLVIDEADVLSAETDRRKLAEFVKLLSDADAAFKLLIVGVAETGASLVANHESVVRCLRETKLDRMKDHELSLIIEGGAAKLGLSFDASVTRSIVSVSSGYPHFTHLIALKCAEDAIAEDRDRISKDDLMVALHRASKDAEGTLTRVYDASVRSGATTRYKEIVCAAAGLGKDEFTSRELREEIARQTGDSLSQSTVNEYLKRLVSDSSATIMRRVAKGLYRFNDPRMPSYVRIANQMVGD